MLNSTANNLKFIKADRPSSAFLVLVCFFFSGVSALIYEVVWLRMLILVFGSSSLSVSTILTTFMAGLALGSLFAGILIDKLSTRIETKKEPDNQSILKVYVYLELAIGIYCLLTPLLFAGVEVFYVSLFRRFQSSLFSVNLIKFILSFLVLIVPTTLMGATFPVLAKYLANKKEELGWDIGLLYGVNTLGAVFGVMAAGFILLPAIGVNLSIYTAVVINIIIAGTIFLITKGKRDQIEPIKENMNTVEENNKVNKKLGYLKVIILVGFGLSGFAALAYEVAWARVLSLIIGTSTYAFSIMLITFISGLAIGSLLFAPFIDKRKNLLLTFSIVEIAIGLSVIIFSSLFERLPYLSLLMYNSFHSNWWLFQIIKFLLCFMVMIIPTILMGATFPIISRIYTENMSALGKSIGNIYSVNTFGSIWGSFLTGFVLIPLIGIQKSILSVAFINILIGLTIFVLDKTIEKKWRVSLAGFLTISVILSSIFIPSWNPAAMNSGVYVYAKSYAEIKDYQSFKKRINEGELLYYKEGLFSTVAVRKNKGNKSLQINGKTDASTNLDMHTQIISGHLPLLLHKEPKKVLLIGLGSGITLGSILQHPIDCIDCLEISPSVVEAANFFSDVNHNALKNERANVIVEDGRNYLLCTDKKYDVIIAEASNLWISGASNLFTKEHFELCKNRLAEDGIICQWLHYYEMSNKNLKTAINTFLSVFPHTTVWAPVLGDILLIGTKKEFVLYYDQLKNKLENENIKNDLKRVEAQDMFSLLSIFLVSERDIRKYAGGSPINTDGHPILEFSVPFDMYSINYMENLWNMINFRKDIIPPFIKLKNYEGKKDLFLSTGMAKGHNRRGAFFYNKQKYIEAITEYEKALMLDSNNANVYNNLGIIYAELKQPQKAVEQYNKAIAINPNNYWAYNNRGNILYGYGLLDEAEQEYRQALKIKPDFADAYNNIGNLYEKKGDLHKAIEEYKKVLEIAPNMVIAKNNLARLYQQLGVEDSR